MSRRQRYGHGPRGPRLDAGRGQPPARTIQAAQTGPNASVAPSVPFRPPIAPAPSWPVASPADRLVSAEQTSSRPPAHGPVNGNGGAQIDGARNGDGTPSGATAPQFRRFIKSRAYVPMHELRRRFGINGLEDDVTPVQLEGGWIYVGLPAREGQLLGELLRGGEVGYELSLDPSTPIVIGVYPMRPVPRH